jgi:hypothetical protein
VNGLRYYCGYVVFYNADLNAVLNNLENPLQIITAVPHPTILATGMLAQR